MGRSVAALTTCPPGDTLGAATLNVGPGQGEFVTFESALICLRGKRIAGPVEIALGPGVYRPFEQAGRTQAVAITHPEAHLVTIRGTAPLDVGLEAFDSVESVNETGDGTLDYYRFRYRVAAADWTTIVQHLDAQPAGASAYALIRRTRETTAIVNGSVQPGGRDHAIHRGIWQIDPLTRQIPNRLVVRLRYQPGKELSGPGRGMAPLPSLLDADFSSEPGKEPRAVILTSVLEFKCSPGVIVEGTELAALKDLAIVGDYDPGNLVPECPGNKLRGAATPEWSQVYPGIETRQGAGVTLKSYVGVANMDGQGVSAQPGSWIVAERTGSSGNERRGFYPTLNAAMQLTETIASGNHTDG